MNFAKKMNDSIKGLLGLIIVILIMDAMVNSFGTHIFGINFDIVKWVTIVIAILVFISDMKDIEFINKLLRRFFNK
jgi:hypothetical protein